MTKTTCDICGAECLPYRSEDGSETSEWATLEIIFRHRPTVNLDLCEKCADMVIRKINESVTGI